MFPGGCACDLRSASAFAPALLCCDQTLLPLLLLLLRVFAICFCFCSASVSAASASAAAFAFAAASTAAPAFVTGLLCCDCTASAAARVRYLRPVSAFQPAFAAAADFAVSASHLLCLLLLLLLLVLVLFLVLLLALLQFTRLGVRMQQCSACVAARPSWNRLTWV